MRSVLLFILSGLLMQSVAQSNKWHGRVQVKYEGSDTFKSQIQNHISRELRALGDVDQTDKQPHFIVIIHSLAITTGANQLLTGYAVYVSVREPIEKYLTTLHRLLEVPRDKISSFDDILAGFERSSNRAIYSWPPDNLDELAKKIITEEVNVVLELERKPLG
jgi:hypothetical protein